MKESNSPLNTKIKYSFEIKSSAEYMTSFLVLKLSGEYDFQEYMSLSKVILDKCNEELVYNVLVDSLELDYSKMTVVNRFYLGEKFAEVLRSKVNIVIVLSDIYITRFSETVAVNRGLKTKIFSDIESAKEWFKDK